VSDTKCHECKHAEGGGMLTPEGWSEVWCWHPQLMTSTPVPGRSFPDEEPFLPTEEFSRECEHEEVGQ
jgi:hypothetical protein